MFENKTYHGIYYSRFVASWAKTVGKINYRFREWLENLKIDGEHIPEEIIMEIYNFADNGKLELETNAKLFNMTYEG